MMAQFKIKGTNEGDGVEFPQWRRDLGAVPKDDLESQEVQPEITRVEKYK